MQDIKNKKNKTNIIFIYLDRESKLFSVSYRKQISETK